MHKISVLILFVFIHFIQVAAQGWKTNARTFTVFQDDSKTKLLTLQVPEESKIDAAFNFATYVKNKTNLSVSYELDDEPTDLKSVKTVSDAALLYYAKSYPVDMVSEEGMKVLNRKVAAKAEEINGSKTVWIEYNYSKKIKGQKALETGKRFLYILPVTGTSIANDAKHAIVVRLLFDYSTSVSVPDFSLHKEIMTTLQL